MNPTAPYQLNVILHGLWGIETNEDGIRAVTVKTEHHVTKAGGLENPIDLTESKYRLKGVAEPKPMTFEVRQNLVVKGRTEEKDKVKLTIHFPYPRDIRSIRRIQTHCDTFFTGSDAPPTPREISIVQVLIYEVNKPKEIKLDPPLKGWSPEPNSFGAINLHFFAEPPNAETTRRIVLQDSQYAGPPHFERAFAKLAAAFGLDIKAVRTGQAEPDDYGVRGLTPQDTIGLHERPSSPGTAMPATSPVNCEMLIINNTKKPAH